jgi:transposase
MNTERDAAIKLLATEGWSGRQIARHLGVSKGVVAGVCFRAGMKLRGRPGPRQHAGSGRAALPLVKELFALMDAKDVEMGRLAHRAGISKGTFYSWRTSRSPMLVSFEAVANALGYEVVLRERSKLIPAIC